MKSKVAVTVIIPNYNREDLIKETLLSVRDQSHGDFECIIVDDKSTDSSIEVIHTFMANDSRFKLLKNTSSKKGASVCRNIGIEHATGVYVMFLDSDDLLTPVCLEQRVRCSIENPDYDGIVFPVRTFTDSGQSFYWNINTEESDLYRFLRLDGVWHTSSVLYKNKAIRALQFNGDLPFLQDWEIAIRWIVSGFSYIKLTEKIYTPDVLIRRDSVTSISQQGFNETFYRSRIKIMRDAYLSCLQSVNDNKINENLYWVFLAMAFGYFKEKKMHMFFFSWYNAFRICKGRFIDTLLFPFRLIMVVYQHRLKFMGSRPFEVVKSKLPFLQKDYSHILSVRYSDT